MYQQEQSLEEDYFFEGGMQETGVYVPDGLYPRMPNEDELIKSVTDGAIFEKA